MFNILPIVKKLRDLKDLKSFTYLKNFKIRYEEQ